MLISLLVLIIYDTFWFDPVGLKWQIPVIILVNNKDSYT